MIDKSSMANLYSKINWYYVIYVLLAFFLIIMAYYLYNNYSTKSSNEYVANRVYDNGDMKSAEIILFYVAKQLNQNGKVLKKCTKAKRLMIIL